MIPVIISAKASKLQQTFLLKTKQNSIVRRKLMYQNIIASNILNIGIIQSFLLKLTIKQDCPFSLLLFNSVKITKAFHGKGILMIYKHFKIQI